MKNEPTPSAPRCAAPLKQWTPPHFPSPVGATDCHAHVVSTDERYPMVANRSYTPFDAAPTDYLSMLERTGMQRGVLVQISVEGTDNRYLLEALDGRLDRLRGICVVDPDVSDDELARLDAAGVRGARLNVLFGGGVGFEGMERLAAKIAPLGWHLQLLVDVRSLPQLHDRIAALPVDVVIDHMGHLPAAEAIEHPGFEQMLDLMRDGRAWVKVSGAYRLDPDAPRYPGAIAMAQRLCAADASRLVYGSDWPHVAPPYGTMPDTGALRNWLGDAVENDAELINKILVTNPQKLYGFDEIKETA